MAQFVREQFKQFLYVHLFCAFILLLILLMLLQQQIKHVLVSVIRLFVCLCVRTKSLAWNKQLNEEFK